MDKKEIQKIKRIIEKHGGVMDEGFMGIGHIHEQPSALKMVNLPDRKYFNPVRLTVGAEGVAIGTTASHYSLLEAKAYLERLQTAIDILEEIEAV